MSRLHTLITILLFAGTLVACGGDNTPAPDGPAQPTATEVPVSTPLPPLATTVPLGSEDRPLRIVLVAEDTNVDLEDLADDMADAVEFVIEVEIVDTSAEALDELCQGRAHVASLNAVAAVVADANNCGTGAVVAQVEGESTSQSQFVVSVTRGINGISAFAAQDFCRTSGTSITGWAVPALRLTEVGINPVDGITSVTDVGDDEAVLTNVLDNTCDVGITSVGAEQDSGVEDIDRIRVIEELPPVPNTALFVSRNLTARYDSAIRDLLDQFDRDFSDILEVDDWISYDPSLYTPLTDLFEAAGFDPLTFGQ